MTVSLGSAGPGRGRLSPRVDRSVDVLPGSSQGAASEPSHSRKGVPLSDQSVARQYANALFTVASRHERVAAVRHSLRAFSELVTGHAELRTVFETPIVTPRRKRLVIDALVAAGGDSAVEVQRLLTMLADRGRLTLIDGICRAFEDRVMEADRAVEADVTTAVELTPEDQNRLAAALGRATNRSVTVRGRVDPALIGGLVAQVGGLVFDGSIAGQLDRMRQRVTAGQ